MSMGDAPIVVDSCGSNKGRGPEAAALGKRRKALPKLVTDYIKIAMIGSGGTAFARARVERRGRVSKNTVTVA